MTSPVQFCSPKASEHLRLLWLVGKFKGTLQYIQRSTEAGLSPCVAFETALHDLDRHYRQACVLEGIQPINQMLDPTGVEMSVRFALDALFGALKGSPDESSARKAFWQIMRRATLPSLTADK